MVMQDRHDSDRRQATLTVAASDSLISSRRCADYVCDGINDQVEILAAIAALPAGGGTIILSEGIFSVGSFSIGAGKTLKGQGPGATTLNLAAVATIIDLAGNGIGTDAVVGRIQDLTVNAPNNYVGTALRLVAGTADTDSIAFGRDVIKNVVLNCPTYTGTAILLKAQSLIGGDLSRVVGNSFSDIKIEAFEYGIVLHANQVAGIAYTSGNQFHNIWGHWTYHFVKIFQETPASAVGGNQFTNVGYNCGPGTVLPLEIDSYENQFLNFFVWDLTGATIFGGVCNAGSIDNLLIGEVPHFRDYGLRNIILNQGNPNAFTLEPRPVTNLTSVLGNAVDKADLALAFNEGWGIIVDDSSRQGHSATLYNSPTWGTIAETKKGKVTLARVSLQYAISPKVSLGGDRTFIWVGYPTFNQVDATFYYFFDWLTADATPRRVLLAKRDNDKLELTIKGATAQITANTTEPGFSANDKVVIIITIDVSADEAKLYWNGVLLLTLTGFGSLGTTEANLTLGNRNDLPAGFYIDCAVAYIVSLPRFSEPSQIRLFTRNFGDAIGLGRTQSSGIATITGAVNTVDVTHSLVAPPTRVFVTALQTGQGDYAVTARGANTFTITFVTQPGASTWSFDWHAQVGEG